MANFFTAHIPDFGGNRGVFPEIGDKLSGSGDIEHLTINYFEGMYSEEARLALRRVCAFIAPFQANTEKPILVGPNEDLPAESIKVVPELMALHALSIVAIERADPTISANRTWALQKYNPHMTFVKKDGLYIGQAEDQSFYIGGITVWERGENDDDYVVADKIRLKGEMCDKI